MSDLKTGELVALATALLWTFSSLAWTSAGKRVGALAVSFIRLIIASAIMMVYGRSLAVCGCRPMPTHDVALVGSFGFLRVSSCATFVFQGVIVARAAIYSAALLVIAAGRRDHLVGMHQ